MICLINPYISSSTRYGTRIDDIGGHQIPLGIYYLAAHLIRNGMDVKVVDAEAEGLCHEDAVRRLQKSGVTIVGITSTTVAFGNAKKLAQLVRRALPGVCLVIGGPHMTAMPQMTMETGLFDYGIVGEGESAFLNLVRYLRDKKGGLEGLKSLYYVKEGAVFSNPRCEYIQDLDSIPFPARGLCPDISIYKPPVGAFRFRPVVNMITSRGCPYGCIFCDNNTFGRQVRFFSAEYVVREIKEVLTEFGAKELAFVDDTFVLDKKRLKKIFQLLAEENIKFPWTCMTRVNNLDFETLQFMAQAGCWQVRIGIESGSQEVLDFIKKGITLKQVEDAVGWCKKLNIKTTGFFMIGHHIDTPQTIDETIRFALSVPLTDMTVTINTPIPGTESYEKAKAYGTFETENLDLFNYWSPIFVPRGLTKEFLLEKQAEFYKRFYLRMSVFVAQLSKIRSLPVLWMTLKSAVLGLNFVMRQKAKGTVRAI